MKNYCRWILLISVLVIAAALSACSPEPEELAAGIQKEIETASAIENYYFAQFVDLTDLKTAKEAAEKALNESDEESYENVLSELTSQNESARQAFDKEAKNYYNKRTSSDLTKEYPFEVHEDEIMSHFEFAPENYSTSELPEWFNVEGNEASDTHPELKVGIYGTEISPDYEFNTVETKEVQVNDGNDKKTALVNTEVRFSIGDYGDLPEDLWGITAFDDPYYVVVGQTGSLTLLAPDLNGSGCYIPYTNIDID